MVNKLVNRQTGQIIEVPESKVTEFLYSTVTGRYILSVITKKPFSWLYGKFLDSKLSQKMIENFIKKNHINMNDYEPKEYTNFNEFFIRKINAALRPFPIDPKVFMSPCDAKVSVYKVSEDRTFKIKSSLYKINDLVKQDISEKYKNGYVIILRLCVDDYHRYCYLDNGYKDNNTVIDGILHTVRPIANDNYEVYIQNQREYTTLHTQNFGDVIQIEVGAIGVGKIVNHHQMFEMRKGDEKGYFKFGGSTIILLVNNVDIDQDLITNTQNDCETIVKMGERLGYKHQEYETL